MELTQQLSLATVLSQHLHAQLHISTFSAGCDLQGLQDAHPILSTVSHEALKHIFDTFLNTHYALDPDGEVILKENAGSPTARQVREHLTQPTDRPQQQGWSPIKRKSGKGKGKYGTDTGGYKERYAEK